ncbi:MAG: AraC family transcriptional regulator [Clostridia bacterium]|nr:AraC family transcriptional regulator [Clostridia bacterium]
MISTELLTDRYLHVNSCGRQHLYGENTGSVRPTGRVDYHILYIAKGCCFVTLEREILCAPAGSVVVYLPNQRQEYHFDKDIDSLSYFIHFSGSACAELLKNFGLTEQNVFFMGKSVTISNLFDTLIDEFHLKFDYYEEICQSLLLHILSVIARKMNDDQTKEPTVKAKLNEICRYIYAHFAEELSVGALAAMCFLSESRFSHLFKEFVGISPAQYILGAKIEMSKELLKNTDISIAQISERVGISNQNYFSRIFKKHTGMTPTEFRKM